MQFKVEFDEKTIQKRLDAIPKKIITPSVNAALNSAGARGKDEGIKHAAAELRVQQKLLKDPKRLQIVRSNFSRLSYRIFVSRRTLTYHSIGTKAKAENFSGYKTRKKKGVRVGSGKTSRFLPGAFVRVGNGGVEQIFRRAKGKTKPEVLQVQRLYTGRITEKHLEKSWKTVARPDYRTDLFKEFDQRIRRLNQQLKR